jgi:RNA polymerase sigma-70 factor (ECF subfamily)
MARGDEQALEALYDRTSSRVMGMTLRILGERASAEEAVLDVFSQAWRQASRYDPARGHVLAWLLNLARSRAIDLQRTRASAAARQAPLEPVEALLKDLGPGPDDSLAIRQRETRVRRALEMLPRLHRQAIMAAFFDGMTHTEIAQTLGAPLGTVKTRIRSGLLTLRDALAKEQVSLG